MQAEHQLAIVAHNWTRWFEALDHYASPYEMLCGVLIGSISVEYAQAYLALIDQELPNVEPPRART